jgi:hypothetical protein
METSIRLRPQVPVYELDIRKISGFLALAWTICYIFLMLVWTIWCIIFCLFFCVFWGQAILLNVLGLPTIMIIIVQKRDLPSLRIGGLMETKTY